MPKINKNDIKYLEKYIRDQAQKTNPFKKITPKLLHNIIECYYSFIQTKDTTWMKDKKNFITKVLDTFINTQMTKIHASVGEVIVQLLNKVLFINKKDNSSLYMDNDFFWTTKQVGKFPFFGTKHITFGEGEIVKEKQKFINNNLVYVSGQPMLRHNSKYYMQETLPAFVNQVQHSSDTYVCKIHNGPFMDFMRTLIYLTENTTLNLEMPLSEKFKYILPKETKLDLLKDQFSSEEFENLITFFSDLEGLSYKKFLKNSKIKGIKAFVTAIISHKLEFIQILQIFFVIINFYCWYPRTWFDARGRQYPYEMSLSITKSPKWRSLYHYITYLQDTQNLNMTINDNRKKLSEALASINREIHKK